MLNENKTTRSLLYTGIVVLIVWSVVPYLWAFRASVLPYFAAVSRSSGFIPIGEFTLQPFTAVFQSYPMDIYFRNSIIVAVAATIISVIFSIPGSYAFARLDFPGRKVLFYSAVFSMMFPWIALTIPVYDIFFTLGLVNTLAGIIIALSLLVLPQTIWLLQGFFRQGIPENIEEAALLDGHSELTAFIRIVLPLSLPAVAAAALFAFLTAWNNFLWVFVLTSDTRVRTATVAVHYLLGSDSLRQWNLLMAGVVLLVAPPVIFYGISQRYVGEGLGA